MEFFHEIYSAYFQVVRKILLDAGKKPLSRKEMEEISKAYASPESALVILPKLTKDGAWSSLLQEEENQLYTSKCTGKKPPLTHLQKAWLKTLLPDPKFRLFFTDQELADLAQNLESEQPLFSLRDFHYFDQYRDGDHYEDPAYRQVFQTILSALEKRRPLFAAYESAKGREQTLELLPCRLQYSGKDDKFRLLAVSLSHGRPRSPYILNAARIKACHLSRNPVPQRFDWDFSRFQAQAAHPVRIRIGNERNALERCMLHFANYEKHTTYEPETDTYLCDIYYDPADETELLIELLSFGPVIRILGPEAFLSQVRKRVKRQHELFYGEI